MRQGDRRRLTRLGLVLFAVVQGVAAFAENTYFSLFDMSSGEERCAVVAKPLEEVLADLRWERRLLLIFPGEYVNPYTISNPGTEERQLAMLALMPEGSWLGGGDPTISSMLEAQSADGAQRCGDRAARRRYHSRYGVQPGADAAILIGLDGTEKARWDTAPTLSEIFAVIDAMPMRRRELEARGD